MRPLSLGLALLAGTVAAADPGPASAQISGNSVKIGVLTDMAGIFSDANGKGSVVAAQMAVADAGGKVGDVPIELIWADHQNKPDIGASIARKWYDSEGVDVIVDIPVSPIALAVQRLADEKKKIALLSSAGSSDITGKFCTGTTIQWTYNTYALANVAGRAAVRRGDDTWFFITTDYGFGHALDRDATEAVTASGGKVLGRALNPIATADFSSYILTAQASGAKVVALASSGNDMQTAVKQAGEFGLVGGGQKLLGLLFDVTDVKGLGLKATQGMLLSTPFYWDRDAESRAFAERFRKAHGAMPTMHQAGVYSAVSHYLKAVKTLGSDAAEAVVAEMRRTPVNDVFAKSGRVREDGQMVHDFFLAEVKTPAESKGEWDYYKILATVPGDEAYQPADRCPRVKK
ncbi:ABC transporter substrate-binding protein [Methylobacterium terricola]|uniref:ABC transporter substrate-binding protein n=1 Tax=Methylobacterium terricola TaxID=2583531 RepID=A0A5C4LGV1_9HYPH|nr:ABC transporter substrate-binding protein [Methylobacterium terricola]TNC13019.1 ABC transporter substrate-binding protein [Methylobacterium terricola]